MLKRIAIIPARGGSKRIPGKNIMDFFGKPMIAWTIEAALKSQLFDRVVVSTDCTVIAEVAKSFGADVPFLRDEYQDDVSSVSHATCRALEQAEDYWKQEFDLVVQLMPNCPMRDASDILHSVSSFEGNEADSQISCFKYGWMNPWWAFKSREGLKPEFIHQEAITHRSQDLPPLYCPTGAIWVANARCLKSARDFYHGHIQYLEIDWKKAVDIDELEDFEMAQAIFLLEEYRNDSDSRY